MKLFRAFFYHKTTLYIVYIASLIISFFIIHISPNASINIGTYHLSTHQLLLILGIISGIIIGVSEPYLYLIFSRKGEWYLQANITTQDILCYEAIYLPLFSLIPTIIVILKGIAVGNALIYVLLSSIPTGVAFLSLKLLIATLMYTHSLQHHALIIGYMALGIAFAGNIALFISTHLLMTAVAMFVIYISHIYLLGRWFHD